MTTCTTFSSPTCSIALKLLFAIDVVIFTLQLVPRKKIHLRHIHLIHSTRVY